jgi:hypothetical protein
VYCIFYGSQVSSSLSDIDCYVIINLWDSVLKILSAVPAGNLCLITWDFSSVRLRTQGVMYHELQSR